MEEGAGMGEPMNIESKIPSGADGFDDLIGGGMERRIIIQIYGEPGSGKSTIATCAACSVLRSGRGVILIDSEGFSAERFSQIAGPEAGELARSLYVYEPVDFDQQGLMVDQCEAILRQNEIGLLVADSITALYRTETGMHGEVQRRLTTQIICLLGYAKKYNIPVLVTNQVYHDPERDRLTGLGGTGLKHISKVIVRLEKNGNHRRAILEKHRSQPEGKEIIFDIVENGIRTI